jgi:hypothetical protein
MIYVTLMGGLGNQLFQYAFGRALSLRSGLELVLNLAYLRDRAPRGHFSPRNYDLDAFAIPVTTIEKDPHSILPPGILNRIERRIHPGKRVRPAGIGFDPALLDAVDGAVYEGYFQSERYFASHRAALLEDLVPRNVPGSASSELRARAETCESVAIHIRRGDYVTNPTVAATFGVCSLDYYRAAVARMSSKVPAPVFFLFSDDMDWVKAHLRLPGVCHYVDHNGPDSAWQDLWIMSGCRHAIIANSSFSWWGAWLNQNPDKVIIAPEPWFAGNPDTGSVIPESWTRLPARPATYYKE